MIIDAHCHIWAGQEPKLESYVDALTENGIDRAVVLVLESWAREIAPGITWKGAGNDYVAACVEKYPDRLIMFGTIPPQLDNSAELLEELAQKYPFMKGLKLHPAIQGFDPANPRVIRFVRKAADLGLPITIHAGDVGWVGRLAYNDPYHLDDLATAVPEATLIVAHGGSTPLVPWLVKRHPNMYMDTSYAPNWPTFGPSRWTFQCIDEDMISFVGAEKVLYGTDMNPDISVHPTQARDLNEDDLSTPAGILRAGLDVIERLRIGDQEKRMILGENAERLLNLRPAAQAAAAK